MNLIGSNGGGLGGSVGSVLLDLGSISVGGGLLGVLLVLLLGLELGTGSLEEVEEGLEDVRLDGLTSGLDDGVDVDSGGVQLFLGLNSQLEDGVEDGGEAGLSLLQEVGSGEDVFVGEPNLLLEELGEGLDVCSLVFLGLGLFSLVDLLDGFWGELLGELGEQGSVLEEVQELGLGDGLLLSGERLAVFLLLDGRVLEPVEDLVVGSVDTGGDQGSEPASDVFARVDGFLFLGLGSISVAWSTHFLLLNGLFDGSGGGRSSFSGHVSSFFTREIARRINLESKVSTSNNLDTIAELSRHAIGN